MAGKHTKKKKTTSGRPGKNQQNSEIRGEIIILIALAVCILLVLSNFGLGGIVGEAVSSVFFGLFGIMAYVLPFAVFGITAFLISNRGNAHAYIKIGAGVVLFFILTAILELIFHPYEPGTSLMTYYQEGSVHQNAGGLTGGCIAGIFCPLIGEIGTYVVLFVLGIICVILITERSLLAPIGRKSRERRGAVTASALGERKIKRSQACLSRLHLPRKTEKRNGGAEKNLLRSMN